MPVNLRRLGDWRQMYRDIRDQWQFERLPKHTCNLTALAPISQVNLAEIFTSPLYHQEWCEVEQELARVQISNHDGSNSGDSRAVFYLVRHLRCRRVLEIGTRLGATTARMALAIRNAHAPGDERALSTVDIDDVNIPSHWSGLNRYSPRESIHHLGCGEWVTFVTQNSLDYFAQSQEKFDLIFLDGSHDAGVVYQEIPAALNALNPGGWILLHDYYPQRRPLWEDLPPIVGPYLAVRRFQREGARIEVLPFGQLPWWTRGNSSATSLALLGKKP